MAKILEFSAAHDAYSFLEGGAAEDARLAAAIAPGRYDYLPPEQAMDPEAADERSDFYALGSILYHSLTGRPPFADTSVIRQVMRLAAEPPEPASQLAEDLPRQIDETLAGLLAKRPATGSKRPTKSCTPCSSTCRRRPSTCRWSRSARPI